MKNRIISLLLVLTLVMSMHVAPVVAAADNFVTNSADSCPCGCGMSLEDVSWTPWNVNEAGSPTSGHYYLDGDYVQDGQHKIMAGDRVVLDLRGNTLTTKSYSRIALVYGRMHVLDSVVGGRFMSKTSGAAYGGVVMVSTNEVNDSVFELCSGTITREADNKGSRRCGLIQVSETATFCMTGGMLINGSTFSTSNPDLTDSGSCIAGVSSKCTIEILGGQIIGGESAGFGGNICQNGGSLTIENCVISDGVSNETSNGGGNINAMTGTTVSLKDRNIRNGWSANNGGNIFLGTGSAVIENTKIEAGVAAERGNSLYGPGTTSGLTIKNCELPGDIGILGTGLKLEGKVKIGLLNHGLRLRFGDSVAGTMDAGELVEGSEI